MISGRVATLQGRTPWKKQPLEVAWSPVAEAVYVGGLTFDAEAYRLVEVTPTATRGVWSSMSWSIGHLVPSPDGRTLAFSAAAFDDDLWLVEGLFGTSP